MTTTVAGAQAVLGHIAVDTESFSGQRNVVSSRGLLLIPLMVRSGSQLTLNVNVDSGGEHSGRAEAVGI